MEPITVVLDDDLAERVARAAEEHGVPPEQYARDLLEAQLPSASAHRLSFIGIGASLGDEPVGRQHRDILREEFARTPASDV